MESTESDDVAVDRLVAALGALGEDAARRGNGIDELGGPAAHRAWLASALLGAVQAEAMAADRAPLNRDARYAIWQRQLDAAGVAQVELIRWQVRRACAPLPAMAAEQATDPIPLAAGQAAEGLQALLSVMVATQGAIAAGDVPRLAGQAAKLREARKVLRAAVDNTELLLELLGSVDI
ncbi:DUF6245 family protein [Actinoplanes sp. NPDC051411]|uniref:DUF6245 family protein n=1 Tax=Actinoplanes sp. NPDC051411 TaxID=3155522 RepID=UPI0034444613